MIDGITILDSYPVYNSGMWWIGIIIGIAIILIGGIIEMITHDGCTSGIFAFLGVFMMGVSCILFGQVGKKEIGTEYQVLIADNVSLVEFEKKYEIKDREGQIYVIRDRKDD